MWIFSHLQADKNIFEERWIFSYFLAKGIKMWIFLHFQIKAIPYPNLLILSQFKAATVICSEMSTFSHFQDRVLKLCIFSYFQADVNIFVEQLIFPHPWGKRTRVIDMWISCIFSAYRSKIRIINAFLGGSGLLSGHMYFLLIFGYMNQSSIFKVYL